jgi:hypothetical protein
MQMLLKTSKLLLLATVLAGSLVSAPPRAEAAKVCPYATYPETVTTYYTDASYTTVVCSEGGCDGTSCATTTPYYRTRNICCSAN